MAVVIGDAVGVGHAARRLPEERLARERGRHASLDLRRQDLASCDLRIEVRYAGLAEMLADFLAMKETGEYRRIGILGQDQRPVDMVVRVIQPGDQRPPV